MTIEIYVAFVVASTILLVLPGPTILLVISYALAGGRRAALWTTTGVALGDATALTLSLVGLGALLSASAALFTALKLVGAAYLVWLGIGMWRSKATPGGGALSAKAEAPATMLRRSFVVTALNPKSIVFFVAFLPQFIVPTAPVLPQMALLGVTFVVLAAANAAGYALLAGGARDVVRRPSVLRAVDRLGGTLLIAAGVWTALRRTA
jgi:threonine/homoserine/homoserine lactone efflux protein